EDEKNDQERNDAHEPGCPTRVAVEEPPPEQSDDRRDDPPEQCGEPRRTVARKSADLPHGRSAGAGTRGKGSGPLWKLERRLHEEPLRSRERRIAGGEGEGRQEVAGARRIGVRKQHVAVV